MYSSTLPSTSALDGGGWSTPCPGHFTPGKNRCLLYRRLGGPMADMDGCGKSRPPPRPGFDPRTVKPVASRYTDCVIPAPARSSYSVKQTTWCSSRARTCGCTHALLDPRFFFSPLPIPGHNTIPPSIASSR